MQGGAGQPAFLYFCTFKKESYVFGIKIGGGQCFI